MLYAELRRPYLLLVWLYTRPLGGFLFGAASRKAVKRIILGICSPATSASIGPPVVYRHVTKAKTALIQIYLYLLTDPAEDPPDFDVGRHE